MSTNTISQTPSLIPLMTSFVAFNPGFPLIVKAAPSLATPEEATFRMLKVAELVNEDVITDVTFDGPSMHLGNVSL